MIPNPMGRARARSPAAWALGALAVLFLGGPASAAEEISLRDALARATAADPAAAATHARVAAAEANARQAGARPNPVIGGEIENFAATGGLLDRTEATVYYEQSLEPAAKREGRTGYARAQVEVARRRGQVRRLDLIRDVQTAYAEALAAGVAVMLAESRLAEAQAAEADIDRRVRSARDPLFAGARAQTHTAEALIARDQAESAFRNARTALAAYWGGTADFGLDARSFFAVSADNALEADGAPTADILLLAAERDAAIAAVRLEESRTLRDPTVRAGVRFLGQGRDVALIVGGSVPLRRYDRNEGGVARAQAERDAAEVDIAAARALQAREVARLSARLALAATESDRIAAEVIPAATRTLELVREGFNRGGFQYLDVTEAQRALIAARARRVEVLRQFHLDQAALDRLTGRHAALTNSMPFGETR